MSLWFPSMRLALRTLGHISQKITGLSAQAKSASGKRIQYPQNTAPAFRKASSSRPASSPWLLAFATRCAMSARGRNSVGGLATSGLWTRNSDGTRALASSPKIWMHTTALDGTQRRKFRVQLFWKTGLLKQQKSEACICAKGGADLLPCNPSVFRQQVQPVCQDVPAQALVPLPDQQLQRSICVVWGADLHARHMPG